jgi:hypothetical protein
VDGDAGAQRQPPQDDPPHVIAKPPNGPITIITLDRGEDVAIRPLVLEDAVWIVGEPLGSMKELIDYIGENDVL